MARNLRPRSARARRDDGVGPEAYLLSTTKPDHRAGATLLRVRP